jgi:LCP family protein required for cell wall assembly
MIRVLAAALVGLLALGAATADVVSRSAALVIQDVSLDALGTDDQAPPPTPAPSPDESPSPPDLGVVVPEPDITTVQNVLLVGVDSREGLTRDQMAEMDACDHNGALTDTIIWVQYLPDVRDVRMVAFPRDIAITLEDGRREKINAIHPIDGRNALIEQVEAMVGDDLDHYVEVNLAGFVTLTDAIGGVEVCLEEPLVDEVVGTIPAGPQVLDGIDAGRFVRSRMSSDAFGGGTQGRAARQQYFLSQALDEVLSAGTLTSPPRLRSLVEIASEAVVVDDGLSVAGMYELASVLRAVKPEQLESAIVPVVAFSDNGYYERIDDSAEELFDALRTGDPLPMGTRSEPEGTAEEMDGFDALDDSPRPSPGATSSPTSSPSDALGAVSSSSAASPTPAVGEGVQASPTPSPSPSPEPSLCD